MAPKALVQVATLHGYSMERTIRNCHGRSYLGITLAKAKILFHCDNQAVISIWESGTTCAKEIMALVHLLYYSTAKYNIDVCITHIAGTENVIADCLSCFQQDKFKKLAPLANPAHNSTPAWPTQSFTKTSCSVAILE